MIRLHCSLLSTFSRRVRIALLEKEIEHEIVLVDMAGGENKSPRYLAMNPYGRVPTLEHDGFVLYESSAILGYLEALKPEPRLFPAEAKARALVEMHMKLCDLELTRHAAAILFPKRFLPRERWDEKAFEQARQPIEKHLAIVAGELGEREFLVGDRFTSADLVYIPHLHFLPLMEVQAPPAVQSWASRLLARPSAVATVPDR
jgi:glutathione S-transferase